ncbi:MAG TPA: histidine phosphatase family protein [Rhodanobacteraceae bacterium]|nr:histidine phosphatase family protein [Rhodanobacteraceae bacterium]
MNHCTTTRLLLVRHAACAQGERILLGRALDSPLTARGLAQANTLAHKLKAEAPTRVETSPRLRARQTARAIAAAANCPLRIAPELDELDFGDWSGCSFADLQDDENWRRWNRERSRARTPAGVTITGVQAMLSGYFADLSQVCAGCTLVLVTHAELIRAALLLALRADPDGWQHYDIAPASVTALAISNGALIPDTLDEVAA